MLQNARTPSNIDCLSPEPVQNCKIDLSKCISSNNIKSMTNDLFRIGSGNIQEYGVSKSLSGTNVQMNGSNTNEQSSSSASGISSPSNTSNNSNKEDEEKYVRKI